MKLAFVVNDISGFLLGLTAGFGFGFFVFWAVITTPIGQ